MKKTKVENISNLRLELFLKQNKEDVRVTLKPGESSWCDYGTTTRSMILYERKSLIKSDLPIQATIVDEIVATINTDEILDKLHTTEDIESSVVLDSLIEKATPSIDDIDRIYDSMDKKFGTSEILTPLEKAQKETEEYKKESEKSYKGKKRGRKKKRGPKPGSKRKKNGENPPTENN